jgi:hypothetical protein
VTNRTRARLDYLSFDPSSARPAIVKLLDELNAAEWALKAASHRADVAELERDRLVQFVKTFEQWWGAEIEEERQRLLTWLLAEIQSLRHV